MKHILITTAAAGALLVLGACESNTTRRYASVGTAGAQGPVGPAGPQGEPGPAGPQGAPGEDGADGRDGLDGTDGVDGTDGLDGRNGMDGADGEDGTFALGEAGMIATGGLVGDNGIGGTGLLADLGDPNSTPPLGDTLSSGGDLLASAGGTVAATGSPAGGDTAVSDLVVASAETVSNVGETLSSFGNGDDVLIDGAVEETAPLLTASLGQATVAGDEDASSIVGLSVLSDEQSSGTVADLGVGTGGNLLTADLAPNSEDGLEIPGVATVDVVGSDGDLLDAGTTLLTASLDDTTVPVGGDGTEEGLVGLSVLSEDQTGGSLVEAGIAGDDTLLNVDLAPNSDDGVDLPGIGTVDVVGSEGDLIDGTLLTDAPDMVGDIVTAAASPDGTEGLLADAAGTLEDTASGLLDSGENDGGLADVLAVADGTDGLLADGTDSSLIADPASGLGDTAEDLLSGEGSGLLDDATQPSEEEDGGLVGNILGGWGN